LVVASTASVGAAGTAVLVVLGSGSGALTLHGAVSRGDAYAGTAYTRIVGGRNNLGRNAVAKSYRGAPVSLILGDLLGGVGESLSPTSTTATLGTVLPYWGTAARPAVDVLRALADTLGAAWRFLPDGSLWFGAETWPASTLTAGYLTTAKQPALGSQIIATDVFSLLPGQVFESQQLRSVEYIADEKSMRVEIWTEQVAS
jgi:hypothetical protein